MLSTLLNKLIIRHDLLQSEAAELLDVLLTEEASDSLIAAALVALASKGETEEELAGFAETMRARCTRIYPRHERFIDTCGTGGSPAKTFNISTAAAFVVSASGMPVAKHGNVGVTSRAGSADVLRALGVNVDLSPERVTEIFDELGICFMLAPLHHRATKRVAAVRRELGVRTIFNLLGPLTNPAGAPFQLIGVSNEAALEKMARALHRLGAERTWIVRGEDGLDEITLAGKTVVHEVYASSETDGVRRFEIAPEEFGFERRPIEHLRGAGAEENARLIHAILAGERKDEALDLVLLNAAAALWIAGAAESYLEAAQKARQSVENGDALAKLEALRLASQE